MTLDCCCGRYVLEGQNLCGGGDDDEASLVYRLMDLRFSHNKSRVVVVVVFWRIVLMTVLLLDWFGSLLFTSLGLNLERTLATTSCSFSSPLNGSKLGTVYIAKCEMRDITKIRFE